jgi:hypothetical protein
MYIKKISILFIIFSAFIFQNIAAQEIKVSTIERPPMAFKTESGK